MNVDLIENGRMILEKRHFAQISAASIMDLDVLQHDRNIGLYTAQSVVTSREAGS
jgi:predicted HTH domain antitoxin